MADVIPGDWVSVRKLAEIAGAGDRTKDTVQGMALAGLVGWEVKYDAQHEPYLSPEDAGRLKANLREQLAPPPPPVSDEPTAEAEEEPKMSAADSARRRRQRGRVPGMN